MDYSVTTLLAQVRRKGSIPNTATPGNQDSDLLKFLNEALALSIPSKVITCREGFYRKGVDTLLSTFSTTRRLRMPYRAIGGRLAAIELLDDNSNVLRKLDEIPYSRQREFYSLNSCMGYIMEAGDLVLVPGMPSGTETTLRMVFYMRPNEITTSLDTAAGSCFTVTAVNTSTGVITLMASHGLLTTDRLDIIKGSPPFEHISYDIYPTAQASTTITVADASRVAVGDVVCKAEKSPYAQLPDPFYPILAHMAAMNYLEASGDRENHKRLAEELPKMEAEAVALISPRNEEGTKKTISNYGALGMVGGAYRRWNRGY